MSVLHSRITAEDYLSEPSYHPAAPPGTPMVMPVGLVRYDGDRLLYGTAHPLVTADGAVVPAEADVRYPTVVPAGRP